MTLSPATEKATKETRETIINGRGGWTRHEIDAIDTLLRTFALSVERDALERAEKVIRTAQADPARRQEYVQHGALGLPMFAADIVDAVRALLPEKP